MQCADSEARDADGVLVDEGEAAVCRICYAEEFEEDRGGFVRPTPCQCLGNRRFVHTSCLARWQTTAFRKRQWAAGTVCHACDSPYLVDLADKRARTPVAVVGGTGLVGRALAIRLLTHPTLRLGALEALDLGDGEPRRDLVDRALERVRVERGQSAVRGSLPFGRSYRCSHAAVTSSASTQPKPCA